MAERIACPPDLHPGLVGSLAPGADPKPVIQALETLAGELLRWNRTHNLIGHSMPRQIFEDLFLDAAAMSGHLLGGRLLDIGSGAGFPGLVLALLRPELEVVLLEPRAKRISFQKHAVRTLELGPRVRPVLGRAGGGGKAGLGPDDLGRFQNVTARAVGGLEMTLELARPFAAPGGLIILPRGQKDQDQARKLGLEAIPYCLPHSDGDRLLLIQRA